VDNYSVWAKGRSKLAQGLTMLAPGVPMFLQGGEWLENIVFGSGYANRIDWGKAVARPEMLAFFHDLIRVRKSNCGFRSNAGFDVYHLNEAYNVIVMHRWCGDGNDLIVVANFGNSDLYDYRIGFPQHGRWYEILNSQAAAYAGNNVGNGGSIYTDENVPHGSMPHSAAITIPQMGLLVFRYNIPDLVGDLNCDGVVDFADINPFVSVMLGGTPCTFYNADINGDGMISFADINPFVDLLTRK
jgi:1,4-alpha-glucan branching enzyme